MVKVKRYNTKKYLAVLRVIETIVSGDDCEDWELMSYQDQLAPREKEMQAKLSRIYRLVHSWNPQHCCHHVHEDWRNEMVITVTKSGLPNASPPSWTKLIADGCEK